MRAPFGPVACATLLLISHVSLVHCYQDDRGYYAEEAHLENVLDVIDSSLARCPTDQVLRTRQTCHVDGAEVQCVRLHCCDTHDYIARRCIPKSVDPCSLKLCEHACEVKGEHLWCTCYTGFQFSLENYSKRQQPYCVDYNECAVNNGGCEQRCVNDPGGFHCECIPPMSLASDGKKCVPRVPIAIPEPLPLVRASSRCYAPCDTVTWLSKNVKQLSDQLRITKSALKKLMDNPLLKDDGGDRFTDGTYAYRVLDATAPLEGGFCRCERGPRGPPGAMGMEGPKGDVGPRGPRGPRGPKGSLDLMLLMLADVRHDIQNLEARVYGDGERPERFNLQKAWRSQRKQEKLNHETETEQELEAFTAPAVEDPIEITPHGRRGEIAHESTTDWQLVKGEPDPMDLTLGLLDNKSALEKLRQYHIYANMTSTEEEDDGGDYDYSLY